jgi:hypothetical protein
MDLDCRDFFFVPARLQVRMLLKRESQKPYGLHSRPETDGIKKIRMKPENLLMLVH